MVVDAVDTDYSQTTIADHLTNLLDVFWLLPLKNWMTSLAKSRGAINSSPEHVHARDQAGPGPHVKKVQ